MLFLRSPAKEGVWARGNIMTYAGSARFLPDSFCQESEALTWKERIRRGILRLVC